jgi:hypothetical protein
MDRRVNHIPTFADRTLHLINARDIRCPIADRLTERLACQRQPSEARIDGSRATRNQRHKPAPYTQ